MIALRISRIENKIPEKLCQEFFEITRESAHPFDIGGREPGGVLRREGEGVEKRCGRSEVGAVGDLAVDPA
jgi:hypothetical protein